MIFLRFDFSCLGPRQGYFQSLYKMILTTLVPFESPVRELLNGTRIIKIRQALHILWSYQDCLLKHRLPQTSLVLATWGVPHVVLFKPVSSNVDITHHFLYLLGSSQSIHFLCKNRSPNLRMSKISKNHQQNGPVNPIDNFRTTIILVPIESPKRELSIGTKITFGWQILTGSTTKD